ncbi:MAG TPA: hypothetical protein VHY08_02990 [Bacillota bacterium]|nr:hypothetical protein [Bacillota bacterium]
MKYKTFAFLIIGFLITANCVFASDTLNVLWEKTINGYVGNIQVANNGNTLIFCKPDQFGGVADIAFANVNGDFFWNKRFVTKVRDFKMSPSGNLAAVAYLQPNQTGERPVITLIKAGKEIWEKPAAESLTFSPLEAMLLCFTSDQTGIYLYNIEGELVWSSESLALKAGMPDEKGTIILGIQDQKIVFIDTNTKSGRVESYPINQPIISATFDPQNQTVFIYTGKTVICYEKNTGLKWEVPVPDAYKMLVDPDNRKLTVYTPGKEFIIFYENGGYYNSPNTEVTALFQLKKSNAIHDFSANAKYMAVFDENKLTLYLQGAN